MIKKKKEFFYNSLVVGFYFQNRFHRSRLPRYYIKKTYKNDQEKKNLSKYEYKKSR